MSHVLKNTLTKKQQKKVVFTISSRGTLFVAIYAGYTEI